jgi:hypothetical protein
VSAEGEAPLWSPLPGPQTLAYESEADVLGYGGAGGGGKTQTLLGLAITRHKKSLLLRRESAQNRGLIDDAREILGNLGRLNENTGVWRDLPGGRQIEFAGCKNPGDEHKHKGRAKDFLGIDEADQFPEHVVKFLAAWVRTVVPGQRCRTVLTFNPPSSAEGRWLLDYFRPWMAYLFPRRFTHPNPAAPGELRWYATLPDGKEAERPNGEPFEAGGETITPKSRTFLPAKVQDNVHLMRTGYLAQLQALPEPLRSQLLFGDMAAGIEDDAFQVCPTRWVELAMERWTPEGKGYCRLDALGVDVARAGAAKTVLAKRYGTWWAPLEKHPGSATPDGPAVVSLIAQAVMENPIALVCLDVIGVGASPYDLALAGGFNLNPIDFREHTDATDGSGLLKFLNLRAWAWWTFRCALDPASPQPLSLPPDRELLADLTAPRWSRQVRGIQIEAKEDIARRIGRSPDCADACVMSLLVPTYATVGGPTRLA